VSAISSPDASLGRPAPPGGGALTKLVTFLAVFLAAGAAAVSGLSAGQDSRLAVVLPVATAVGVGLGILALTRFQVYVMVMLVLRASLDLAKLSGSTDTTTATTTAATTGGGATRALDPASLVAVTFLLAAALWLAAQHRAQGRLPGSLLRRALLVLVVAAVLSVFGSARPATSALEVLSVLAVVAMFVVLEQMMVDRQARNRLLAAVFASTLFPLAFTALGYLVGNPRTEVKGSFLRVTGTFTQSNTFGRYLMLMVIFGFAVHPYVSRRLKLPLALILAGCSGLLLLTYTRTAIVGAAIGLAVVGLVQSKRLLAGLVVASLCALLLVPQLSGRFTGLTDLSGVGSGEASGNTLVWRLNYWTEVLPLANANPVTGIGLAMTEHTTEAAKQPHSDFVRAYVEMGLIGLGAYLAVVIALVGLGRRAIRVSPKGSLDRAVGVGVLGCAVAFVAVSMAANVALSVVILWYLFAFAAAASAVVRERQQSPPVPDQDPVPR
jgi:putative inorganic carbon (HCO3(-)) transporter